MNEPKVFQCLTLSDVASRLSVSLPKVKRMVRDGIITTVVIDGETLVTPEAFAASAPGRALEAQYEAECNQRRQRWERDAVAEAASMRELNAQFLAYLESHPAFPPSPASDPLPLKFKFDPTGAIVTPS